jgi:hypothetical protein
MNERIRELVKQAGGIGHDDDGNELTPVLVGKDLDKFAELIIQECCSAIRLDDVFNGGKFQGTILKHFGIDQVDE